MAGWFDPMLAVATSDVQPLAHQIRAVPFEFRFDLLTNQLIDAQANFNVFETNPFLIARMDQLSRKRGAKA